jgi:F-type H+-transporting ATPase subunit b
MGALFHSLGIDGKLLLAQTVNFLLVFWLLSRFVFPKVLLFLEQRKQRIQQGLELTQKAEHEMERIGEARHRELEKARGEGEAITAASRAQASAREREVLAGAREDASEILVKAKEEAERARQDVLRQAREEIQKNALLVAEKILSRAMSQKDEEHMEKELTKELKQHV